MIPLVDGDILRYEGGFAFERPGEPIGHFDSLAEWLDQKVFEIKRAVGATEAPIFFFTEGKVFRHDIFPEYKAHRTKEKPFHFKHIRDYLELFYNCVDEPGIEADDLLAMVQEEAFEHKLDTVICSRDKDLRQVPGWHYSWECGRQAERPLELVEEHGYLVYDRQRITGAGDMWLFFQALTGDPVDNIKGCKGVGPIKAYQALRDCETFLELYSAMELEFQSRMGDTWEQDMKLALDLVFLRRDENQNFWEWAFGDCDE